MSLRKLLLVLLTSTSATLFAQNGSIKVKVIDDNNLNLPGALVKLQNTNIIGVTDTKGEVLLSKIPNGNFQLVTSYIGYTTNTQTISVNNNFVETTIRLQAGVTTLKGVMVLGDRLKGQAKALNQQKNGTNIANIISADQIGRFPDANLGDALKRVPGVTMQNDQGEARNIIIRGLAPQFNAVTLNGDRIPSAEGDNRLVQMDLIPSDMVQTVEVNKTITADMEPDAIGGSVNLVTRSAPNKFRLSGTTSLGYNAIRGGQLANVAFVAGGRLFKKKLGIVVSGNINDNVYGSDNVEAVWSQTAKGVAYVSQHDIRVYDVRRIRRSLQTTIDYKINNKNTITLSGMYNWRDDWENRYRLRMRDIAPTLNANGDVTGYRGRARIETKGGIDNDRVRSARLEEQKVKQASAKGEHIIKNGIKVNWSSSYSTASEFRPNERYFDFQNAVVPVNMDIANPEQPNITFVTQPATSTYAFRRLWELNGRTDETEWNNKINIKIPLELFKGLKTEFKAGGRFARKTKERNNIYTQYNRTAATNAALANLSVVPNFDATNSNFLGGKKYAAGTFVDPGYLGGLNLYNTNNFTPQDRPEEYLTGNYYATENIWAGYGSIDQQINSRLSINAGLRLENTYLNYIANSLVNNTAGQKINVRPQAFKNVLPSFVIKYATPNDVVIRAAYSSTIARPAFFDLAPYLIINPSDNEIRSGNTNLRPTVSNNVDVMFEKYFKSVGLISAGVFYKRLNNFFYTLRDNAFTTAKFAAEFPNFTNPIPAGQNWIFTKPFNGDNLDLYGFEVAFQRQLDFLPGAWKGLGVYVNYTYTKSSGNIFTPTGIQRSGVALPGTAPHIVNASLSWENKKFLARIALNYTADYVDELGNDNFNDRFYDNQLFLDFNTSYTIKPKLRWFFEMNNITNQPLRYYQGIKERTVQLEYYRERWNTGLKFDLF
jgi:TonB-dependent receptor